TDVQTRYTVMEQELLAIVFALRKFRVYVEGCKFTVKTDNRSLKWLKTLRDPSIRIQRWSLLLQEFDFDIEHVSGTQNVVADWLSRAPVDDDMELEDFGDGGLEPDATREEEVACRIQDGEVLPPDMALGTEGQGPTRQESAIEQRKDEKMKEIIDSLVQDQDLSEYAGDFYVIDHVLNRYVPERLEYEAVPDLPDWQDLKMVVPQKYREAAMRAYHAGLFGGHGGTTKT